MSDLAAVFRAKQADLFPIIWDSNGSSLRHGFAHDRFEIGKQHLALNGYLHAARSLRRKQGTRRRRTRCLRHVRVGFGVAGPCRRSVPA
jgi:hypothetical protein